MRGAGFEPDGSRRKIKPVDNLMADIKRRSAMRDRKPAMAICITMYNEDIVELKNTLRGVLHNYNSFRMDERYKKKKLNKDDFSVVIVCDGYDNMK